MSNSSLYNQKYKIPNEIIYKIKTFLVIHPTGNGIKRAKNIINSGYLTYQSLKRLKNFFDYYDGSVDDSEYVLAGGGDMKAFVDRTLKAERDAVSREKEISSMVDNAKEDIKLTTKAYKTPRLNEGVDSLNVICVIVNKYNEFLIVKRSNHLNQWMPNRWSLVGGTLNSDETPEDGCVREVKEEVGLEISNLNKRFVIERDGNVEYIFAVRYEGNLNNVKLNRENSNYVWLSLDEIKKLNDKVPNLVEYILIAFKEYNN